jgi:hypothetical protein
MEINGKIISIAELRQGISQNGNSWMSQDFVIEYKWWPNQQTPSNMVFTIFGEERIKKADIQIGKEVRIRYHAEAHPFNNRWYGENRADIIFPAEDTTDQQSQENAAQPKSEGNQEAAPTPPTPAEENKDDLPF